MSTKKTKETITEYANKLLNLANDGLENILPEHLKTIGETVKSQSGLIEHYFTEFRKAYKIKKAQEAVAPVQKQVETFIDSSDRPHIIAHSHEAERHHLKQGTTTLIHSVYIPMDDRSHATVIKAEDDLREQYKGFPKNSVKIDGFDGPDCGLHVTAVIDLTKPGVKEAAKSALTALKQAPAAGERKSAVDPELVKASRSTARVR